MFLTNGRAELLLVIVCITALVFIYEYASRVTHVSTKASFMAFLKKVSLHLSPFREHYRTQSDNQSEYAHLNGHRGYVSMCDGNFDNRRLGNQLFNLAAMIHVAQLTGRQVAMPRVHPHGWLDRWFEVPVKRVDNIQKDLCPCQNIGESKALAYETSILGLPNRTDLANKTLLVCGWFQSWKYTVGTELILKHYLRLKKNVSEAVYEFLRNSTPASIEKPILRVGVHIRCGDIMRRHFYSYGYTVPKDEYFEKAMLYFRNNFTDRSVQFIITTDNLKWVRSTYSFNTPLFFNDSTVSVIYSENNDAGFDMALLSMCDAVLMTTGTYGWWGAWLANKTTIYYKTWPRPGSHMTSIIKRDDFFHPSWIPMDGPYFSI